MQEWIKERMKSLKIRQSDLASALGLPGPRVSEIIHGRRLVKLEEAQPLADALEMPVSEVLIRISGELPTKNAPENYDPDIWRSTLKAYMASKGLSVNGWATQAGISEGGFRNFLSGRNKSLSIETLEKLAAAVELTHMELMEQLFRKGDFVSPIDRAATSLEHSNAALLVRDLGNGNAHLQIDKVVTWDVATKIINELKSGLE